MPAGRRGRSSIQRMLCAIERLEADYFFEIAQLAFGAADLQAGAVAGDRDSGGVIAAILQLSEAFDDDGDDLLLADVSNDSAHG